MSNFLRDLLAEVFAAEGSANPGAMADKAVAAMERAKALDLVRMAQLDRANRVYELRKTITEADVAVRLNVSIKTIQRDVKRILLIKRGA